VIARVSGSDNRTDDLRVLPWNLILSGSIIGLALGLTSCEADSAHSDAAGLSFKETCDYLRSNLAPIRSRLRSNAENGSKIVPFINVTSSSGPPTRDAREGDITLSVNEVSMYGLSKWVAMLQGPTSTSVEPGAIVFEDRVGAMTVWLSHGLRSGIHVCKSGGFTKEELSQVVASYEGICADLSTSQHPFEELRRFGTGMLPGGLQSSYDGGGKGDDSPDEKAIAELGKMGIRVFDPQSNAALTWDNLAGYDDTKKEITDTVLNYLKHPDVYESVVKGTRVHFESNRPRAVLLEGPPGTGTP
jgi:hypothetical protein